MRLLRQPVSLKVEQQPGGTVSVAALHADRCELRCCGITCRTMLSAICQVQSSKLFFLMHTVHLFSFPRVPEFVFLPAAECSIAEVSPEASYNFSKCKGLL